MSACKVSSDTLTKVSILFGCVAVGAVAAAILGFIFFYKWHMQLEREYRKKKIARLIYSCIVFASMERIMRLIEIWMWYHGPRAVTVVLYHVDSTLLNCYFACLFLLLVEKLSSSFENSAYEISKKEKMILYSLITVEVIGVSAHMILSDLRAIKSTHIGKASVLSLTLVLTVMALVILIRVDLGFAKRLRSLVATNAARETSPGMDTPTGSGCVSPEIPRFATFSDLHRASVSHYGSNHRRLLKTAAKSMVIAVWLSVGFMIYGLAGTFLVFAHCANIPYILSHGLTTLAYPIITLSVSFSLPHSEKEFEACCSYCNKRLKKLVAWQTTRQVLQLVEQNSNTNASTTVTHLDV